MGFLAPILLWGTLAAGVPVAIHLFFRSRYRTVPWAAMKFLLTSVEQTSRRLRFQELVLLMLRILLLVVLALALARPVVSSFRDLALIGLFVFVQAFAIARLCTSGRPKFLAKIAEFGVCEIAGILLLGCFWLISPTEAAIGGRGDAVDAVFVFDTSMSMGAKDGGKTRLQRGQAEALRVIDALPPHSTVQIVTCAGRGEATPIGPRLPANLDEARVLLDTLTTGDLGTDLHPGVQAAAKLLRNGQSPNKELYVFSDMQKQGWTESAAGLKQELDAVKEKASVVMVRCGTAEPKNVAVVGITPQSEIPRPGDRVAFAVLIRNSGRESVKGLTVTLSVDGNEKEPDSQALPYIGPGETKAVAMSAKLDKPGLRVLTARVSSDDLDGDNRLDQVIQVRDFVNVLVIDGAYDERDPERSSSYFLMHALAPVKDVARPTYYVQPRVVPARLASPALLAKADICFMVNAALKPNVDAIKARSGVVPGDFVEELGRFVRQGHGLVLFSGSNVRADAYNDLLGKQEGLLPLALKGNHKVAGGEPMRVNRASFRLPAFGKFTEDDYYKDFNKVEIWQVIDLNEESAASEPPASAGGDQAVTVALRSSDGRPLIATRKVDAGEVVFVATSTDFELDPKTQNATWTDWPYHPVHIPFIHTLIGHLMHGQSQSYNVVAGETLHWYPTEKGTRTYTLIHPGGHEERLGHPAKRGHRMEVTADNLLRAGVYRLVAHLPRAGEDAETPGVKDIGIPIAAAPDLRETEDLSSFTDAEMNDRLGFTPIHLIADSGAETISVADRVNREWTAWLLMAVLVFLVFESMLAWVCGRAW